jgi:uroporphyrin-III C-methyltransferase
MIGDRLEKLISGGPAFEPGSVWLVGAGPGDPGYLTVNALVGLSQADVVLHDALIDDRILNLAKPSARRIYSGKRAGGHSIDQESISAQLIDFAQAGQRVLRLKGGDPMVFGRGGEEMMALADADIPFRIVPGVTAGLAALAVASIPATLRDVNRAVVFATGHTAEDAEETDWAALAALGQPLVLYMALRRLDRIATALIAGGMAESTPLAVISSATMSDQDILVSTLAAAAGDAERARIEPPAVVVIGDIVQTRARLQKLAPAFAEALT